MAWIEIDGTELEVRKLVDGLEKEVGSNIDAKERFNTLFSLGCSR